MSGSDFTEEEEGKKAGESNRLCSSRLGHPNVLAPLAQNSDIIFQSYSRKRPKFLCENMNKSSDKSCFDFCDSLILPPLYVSVNAIRSDPDAWKKRKSGNLSRNLIVLICLADVHKMFMAA